MLDCTKCVYVFGSVCILCVPAPFFINISSMTAGRRWPGMIWDMECSWAKLECKPFFSPISLCRHVIPVWSIPINHPINPSFLFLQVFTGLVDPACAHSTVTLWTLYTPRASVCLLFRFWIGLLSKYILGIYYWSVIILCMLFFFFLPCSYITYDHDFGGLIIFFEAPKKNNSTIS